jgi:5S rRNA maturation endonuclease (ribonuclease M5)
MQKIEWKHLKGLHQLYKSKQTRLKITNNDFINQVILKQRKLIKYKVGNHSIIEASARFNNYYEQEFLETYEYYNNFFQKTGIENDAKKSFDDEDLKALMFVFYNKEELKKNVTTEKKLSALIYKNQNSKYLSNKLSVKNAVLKILELDQFPEKDPKNNQWRFVVDCIEPEVIVLCENLDCLKVPLEYKNHNIELWYVGGNNTKPLEDISQDKLKLPIYYFCDWDYNGLQIYSSVKRIFKSKGVDVKIIQPQTQEIAIDVDVKHHNSKWNENEFSNLNKEDFSLQQVEFINQLIIDNKWIEEESLDLVKLLKTDNII